MLTKKILLPSPEHFPLLFEKADERVNYFLGIISKQMDVDPNEIKIAFYDDRVSEIRGDFRASLFTQKEKNESYSSGLYGGRDAAGKFLIGLERAGVDKPNELVATLAHEIAHIKILGEGRMEENSEPLTDMVTVFFGLGIFNANASFSSYADYEKWSYAIQGYLPQQEWAYALALYAYIKKEKNPDWVKFLTPNIQSDFKKSELYIYDNTDKVLV